MIKRCKDCGLDKPVEEFNWRIRARGIRQTRCRECFKVFLRNYQLARKYSISTAEYIALKLEQGGRCALCGHSEEELEAVGYIAKLVPDHDHTNSKLRKLLCNRCNMGLGFFNDDPERLIQAAAYIKEYRD